MYVYVSESQVNGVWLSSDQLTEKRKGDLLRDEPADGSVFAVQDN